MQYKQVHDQLSKFLEELGIVDFFFVGVDLEGKHFTDFGVGNTRNAEYGNHERVQRMLGIIEEEKIDLVMQKKEREAQEREERES